MQTDRYTLAELLLLVVVSASLAGIVRAKFADHYWVPHASEDVSPFDGLAVPGGALGLCLGVWMGWGRRPRVRNAILGGICGAAAGAVIATTLPQDPEKALGSFLLLWCSAAATVLVAALVIRFSARRKHS